MGPVKTEFLGWDPAPTVTTGLDAGHRGGRATSRVAPGLLPLLPWVLMLSACGGGDVQRADASAASPDRAAVRVSAAAAPDRPGTPAAPRAVAPTPLHAWLQQWAARRGAMAQVAPGIGDRLVTMPVDSATSTDALLAAVGGGADVVLSYTAPAGGPPRLAAVAVHGPGGALRARPPRGHDGAPSAQDAPTADPAQELARLVHDLASPEEPARRQALVRSFEIDRPLPVQALLSAAQGDRSGTVRRYALMALERHPDANPAFLRTLVDRARVDADPRVRQQAAEIEERLDADDMSAEVWPGH